MKGKSICLVVLLSVASLYSALGATTVKKSVTFTSDMSLPSFYEVEYEVDETGARIIAPKTVSKPAPYTLLQDQLSFLGYYGKFHTSDSGEEEVELKVYDENGNTVGFLPGVVLPPAPDEFYAKWAPKEDPKPQREDNRDGTEPILYFVESFMPGDSNEKIAEYSERIRDNDEDYEAYIYRGLTWLTSLSEHNAVLHVVNKFRFDVNDDHGTIRFLPLSSFDFGFELQDNPDIDAACEKAVPVLMNALADFAKVPKNWAGAVDFTYNTDVTVSFGYADALVARAFCCELLSVLYVMKGYNTVSADLKQKPMDLAALAEAQRWMRTAAEMVNAFVDAEADRPDPFRDYFFNLDGIGRLLLRENARNFVDVPYWTVRFDFTLLPGLLFLNGDDDTATKKAKRNVLRDYQEVDVTFRNLFEGKLGADGSTFPVLYRGFPLLDEAQTDPTFAGTFPGMSRRDLAQMLSALADPEVPNHLPDDPYEEIAHYGILYDLPEGAENNPGNPATFASDLERAILLLNPTMAGYDFAGWTQGGVIQVGTEETLTFRAMFEPLSPKTISGAMLLFR